MLEFTEKDKAKFSEQIEALKTENASFKTALEAKDAEFAKTTALVAEFQKAVIDLQAANEALRVQGVIDSAKSYFKEQAGVKITPAQAEKYVAQVTKNPAKFEFLKELVEGLEEMPVFSTGMKVAGSGARFSKESGTALSADQFADAVEKFAAEHKIGYVEAFTKFSKENPDAARAYRDAQV